MNRKTSKILPDFEYFIKGDNPKLLIHSGTHGDEFDVIEFVRRAVKKYEDKLPDFIFVPIVSPSAVNSKTRKNINGNDLNRIFYSDSKDLEVKTNIKIIGDHRFDLMVSFHEDFEFMDYYVYDEGFVNNKTDKLLVHNKFLKESGVNLFTGIDDPILKSSIVDGYKKFIVPSCFQNDGMITSWMLSNKVVIDTLTPEIPMKLDSSSKEIIIDSFFKKVLI